MQVEDLDARVALLTDVVASLVRGAVEPQRGMAMATLRRHSCRSEGAGRLALRLLEELRERRMA